MEINEKKRLSEYGFSFKKAYGQNFLTDENLLTRIVEKAGVDKNVSVLEIGCGAGALTKILCKKAGFVLGYEIDTRLKPVLKDALSSFDNYEIVYKDVLKEDMKKIEKDLGGDYILVANLPYYITTDIVMAFLENATMVTGMVIMVQEEVAMRFSAKPSSSDYGAITVAINLRGEAEIIERVPREKFTPSPNVDSAVVKITVDKNKNADVDKTAVRNVVRTGFNNRRKMFINNLMKDYKLDRNTAENVLIKAGVPLTARGETFSAEQYITLSEILKDYEK